MMHGWGWSGFGPYGFGGYSLIGSLISLIFLIIFLVVIYFVIKKIFFNGNFDFNRSNKDEYYDAIKILNEKLVKGEITEEEYIRKKELILKNLK
ncbi:SHOCT domain-containing protein [Marinitoga litoralis]|uniref:SHOCT domain-containing protein n=1 Tax=Marinitoga litoralis TaxID=570855 RepID=UPI001960CD67|nr:SHOCT domain-containing protein [Marinitoga litoralis]MBM7559767.1 putative membrane protein [Marinitoga litoralis]